MKVTLRISYSRPSRGGNLGREFDSSGEKIEESGFAFDRCRRSGSLLFGDSAAQQAVARRQSKLKLRLHRVSDIAFDVAKTEAGAETDRVGATFSIESHQPG